MAVIKPNEQLDPTSLTPDEREWLTRDDIKRALQDPEILKKVLHKRKSIAQLAKPPAKNYREIDLNIGGNPIIIGGMAHPTKYLPPKQTLDDMMKELASRGFSTMISLDKRGRESIKEAFEKQGQGMQYIASDIKDFTPPNT